jgi:hypothetical protein
MEDLNLCYGSDEELTKLQLAFKNDDVQALVECDVIYMETMTETAAFFGANKCLLHMIEEGVEISPLINLYAIVNNHKLVVSIPHDDELKMCVICGRFDRLKDIELPDIDNALNVMSYALYNYSTQCSSIDEECSSRDPIRMIYDLYPPEEWQKVIKGIAKYELVRYERFDILEGIPFTKKDYFYFKKYDKNLVSMFPQHYQKRPSKLKYPRKLMVSIYRKKRLRDLRGRKMRSTRNARTE